MYVGSNGDSRIHAQQHLGAKKWNLEATVKTIRFDWIKDRS